MKRCLASYRFPGTFTKNIFSAITYEYNRMTHAFMLSLFKS